jgi:hypothetical protein
MTSLATNKNSKDKHWSAGDSRKFAANSGPMFLSLALTRDWCNYGNHVNISMESWAAAHYCSSLQLRICCRLHPGQPWPIIVNTFLVYLEGALPYPQFNFYLHTSGLYFSNESWLFKIIPIFCPRRVRSPIRAVLGIWLTPYPSSKPPVLLK